MADDSSEVVREMAEAVAATNVKVVGEGPSFYANLAMANAVANQQAMQQLQLAITGKVAEAIIAMSPSEGGADVAALQQLMKGAQTTPPVTTGM
jgi:alkylation response protein AidB-like acyl-CoA dehydrogenase